MDATGAVPPRAGENRLSASSSRNLLFFLARQSAGSTEASGLLFGRATAPVSGDQIASKQALAQRLDLVRIEQSFSVRSTSGEQVLFDEPLDLPFRIAEALGRLLFRHGRAPGKKRDSILRYRFPGASQRGLANFVVRA
ncbi:hypothetical protein [Rhodovibrio salinarum]|uniref:hypothetical protein n=1 Tax=Rhodovibrio salinarum TaxID=1087 RepID=UPI0012DF05B1|nr:hypothetical protein [Rhodovibrio salinarum]